MSIPLSVPSFKGNESRYVQDCIETGWVSTAGTYVTRFEAAICEYTGAKYAVAVNSGTSALHMALLVGGVTAGDEVIVPSMTFIATANAVKYVGAEPVFVDCDDHFSMNVQQVMDFLKDQDIRSDGIWNNASQRRIKAIIPVHLYGNAVVLDELIEFCKQHKIIVIEDAAESLGTFYQNNGDRQSTGVVGDFGCFSFNGNKVITSGGGGMIVTSNEEYAQRLKHLTTQAKTDAVMYVHDEVGYNNRMTNLSAALGLAQLEQIETFIAQKEKYFNLYDALLKSHTQVTLHPIAENIRSNYWFFLLKLDANNSIGQRDGLMEKFSENKIQVRPAWRPLHLQTPYLKQQSLNLSKTMELWERVVCLPCSPGLSSSDIEQVVEIIGA